MFLLRAMTRSMYTIYDAGILIDKIEMLAY